MLVVTTCSSRKRYAVKDPPTFDDLTDLAKRARIFEQLSRFALPARELYVGRHHISVMSSVDRLRKSFPKAHLDLVILSGGYGVVSEFDRVVPYDATFSNERKNVILQRAAKLRLSERLVERVRNVEISIFLLSSAYSFAAGCPLRVGPLEVYFVAQPFKDPPGQVVSVPSGIEMAKFLRVAPRMVRAALFGAFVDVLIDRGWPALKESLSEGKFPLSYGRILTPL